MLDLNVTDSFVFSIKFHSLVFLVLPWAYWSCNNVYLLLWIVTNLLIQLIQLIQ